MGAQGRLCALVLCALVGACGIHGHAPRWPVGRPLLRAARMPRMMGTRFERVLLDKLSAVGSETSMRTIFQQVDDEGSGKISSQDLYDALKQLNLNLTRRDVDRAIYRFDQKGDGSLNYAEFVRMLEDLLQIPHDEVLVRTGALAQARRYTTSSLWLHALLTMHKSSLLRHIVQPVAATATWSALLVGLSRVGWLTPNGPLSLLLWPKIHTLLGGALGLLLVFRTNSAYARMWEGRQIWERIHNLARDLSRFSSMYARNIGRLKTRRIAHLLCAFPVLLERHLSNEAHEPLEIDDSSRRRRIQPHWSTWSLGRLDLSVRRRLNRVSNRPLYVCQCVAHELKELYDRKVLTARESLFALDLVNKLSDSIGACERLVTTPVPLNYARHTSRFLTIWCLTLPLSLVNELGFALVPAMAFVAWALYGIQELGLSIEQPFEKQLRTDVLIASIIGDLQQALLDDGAIPSDVQDEPLSTTAQPAGPAAPAADADASAERRMDSTAVASTASLQQPAPREGTSGSGLDLAADSASATGRSSGSSSGGPPFTLQYECE